MKPQDLLRLAEEAEGRGLKYVGLCMPLNFKGRQHPLKVRTPFGLCRWYPSSDPDKVIIHVEIEQIRKYFSRILAAI